MTVASKPKVKLLEVKSVSKKVDEVWHDLFNVRIKVQDTEFDFEDDLKNGLLKACQNIFSSREYDYKSFDYDYSRNPKKSKRMFGD